MAGGNQGDAEAARGSGEAADRDSWDDAWNLILEGVLLAWWLVDGWGCEGATFSVQKA